MTAGIGHNNGPSLDPGVAWRRHCWTRARAELLPHLPIEVLRGRVARARELGLDYRTYASIRATSGHDVVAFLFSSNALRLTPAAPAVGPACAGWLEARRGCDRLALAQGRLTAEAILLANPGRIDAASAAPPLLGPFAEIRDALRAALGRRPAGGTVLVGVATLERDWCAAGRLAGYLPAERVLAT